MRHTSGFRKLLAAAALLTLACSEPPPPQVEPGREAALLDALVAENTADQEAALAEIEAAGDQRFVAPLVELVRAGQLGIAGRNGYNQRIVTLERLSGQSLGGDWFGWVEWFGGTELAEPPGFASWKGRLFAPLDPRYATLLDDDAPSRIRVAEIDWGGVPIDGIPPLDDPAHTAADEAIYLADGEPVLGVRAGGQSRAYPFRILDWHELANDTLGGIPIAVVTCALCGSGVAYDARIPGREEPLRFGTSGFLYKSNKLMLDRATETLWTQLTGRPVFGPLADEEIELSVLPAVVTTWSEWKARHPETTVLDRDTGFERRYRPGDPYASYFASRDKLFPVYEARSELPSKERVYGVAREGDAKAWTLASLVEQKVVHDRLGDEPLVLVANQKRISVEGVTATGPLEYDAGGSVRAYVTDERFRLGPDDRSLVDEDGGIWRIEEEALVGPAGKSAPRVAGTLAYWFAWQGFHPETLLVPEPE